jgi:hypothetical protein
MEIAVLRIVRERVVDQMVAEMQMVVEHALHQMNAILVLDDAFAYQQQLASH